ncbi:DUF4817 domain-containing protein [Trichonephila clavipes]|nr:DUF4817 domain-containing protein [Trichonephila clavipes]
MNRLTPEQRFQIVQFYFENNGSVRNTYRTLRPFYRRTNHPSGQLIRLTVERFRTTFTLIDNSHPQRRRTVITEEAIATIERSIEEDPNEFVEWVQNEIAVVPDFHKRILFSDEAHFWLNGYVNKQNCRIFSEANPQVYVETPLHPEKLTVWCVYGLVESLCGGYVKSLVYADKLQTLDLLEDNICSVIADIRPQMLENVIENWTSRLDYIRVSRGSHMPEIIFKM